MLVLSVMRYILLPLHEPLLEVCMQLTGMQLHLLADLGAGRFVLWNNAAYTPCSARSG